MRLQTMHKAKQMSFSLKVESSFVEAINEKKTPLFNKVIRFENEDAYVLDVAVQYNESYKEQIFSFVNNINTEEGGTRKWF